MTLIRSSAFFVLRKFAVYLRSLRDRMAQAPSCGLQTPAGYACCPKGQFRTSGAVEVLPGKVFPKPLRSLRSEYIYFRFHHLLEIKKR